ncbi:MAG TPA: tetratricopeptide repeat protein [Vicinamibacteria bacterium]|nr:tetratricopeptide repeat protein [Vicinamibacteria bacterium]
MTNVQALSLLAFLSLQPDDCTFVVLGEREPPGAFLRAVNLYRSNGGGDALRELESLDDNEVQSFVERVKEVRVVIRRGSGNTAVPEDRCLLAASLLVIESGMERAESSLWSFADARFDAGFRLSSLVESEPLRSSFQRDALLLAGLFHQDLIFKDAFPGPAFERADRYLQAAVKRYPRDVEVLVAGGALLEWAGSLPEEDPSFLKEAQDLYTQALKTLPEDAHALLRLGWVLRKRRETERALSFLKRITDMGAEDDLVYRAWMGLGALAAGAGDYDMAATYYQNAVRLIPAWQPAHIGLAYVLHESGSHTEARRALDAALAIEASDDPLTEWWSYELGLAPRYVPLLERMREETAW